MEEEKKMEMEVAPAEVTPEVTIKIAEPAVEAMKVEPVKRKPGRPKREPVTVAGDPPDEWLKRIEAEIHAERAENPQPMPAPILEVETPKVNIVEEKAPPAPTIDRKTREEMAAGRRSLARLRGE